MIDNAITPYERALATAARYLRPAGLELPPTLTPSEEEQIIIGMGTIGSAIQWARGDLGVFIFEKIRNGWGDAQEKEDLWKHNRLELAYRLGVEPHTLQNEISMARAYPMLERIAGNTVTWSHHKLVVNGPPERRRDMLLIAEENGWSVQQLQEYMLQDQKRTLSPHGEYTALLVGGMMWQQRTPNTATIETAQGSIEVKAVLQQGKPVLEARGL